MTSLHPTYHNRRGSQSMPRPRPKERSMTSSSTGSARRGERLDPISVPTSARPARPHRNSTTSYRSSRSYRSSFSNDALAEAFSDGEGSVESEEEWERGETVKQVKRKKTKDEPMSPVSVVRESPSLSPWSKRPITDNHSLRGLLLHHLADPHSIRRDRDPGSPPLASYPEPFVIPTLGSPTAITTISPSLPPPSDPLSTTQHTECRIRVHLPNDPRRPCIPILRRHHTRRHAVSTASECPVPPGTCAGNCVVPRHGHFTSLRSNLHPRPSRCSKQYHRCVLPRLCLHRRDRRDGMCPRIGSMVDREYGTSGAVSFEKDEIDTKQAYVWYGSYSNRRVPVPSLDWTTSINVEERTIESPITLNRRREGTTIHSPSQVDADHARGRERGRICPVPPQESASIERPPHTA